MNEQQTILITGASSGFGRLTARSLAEKGHRVFATMREAAGRNLERARELEAWAAESGLALEVLELDVTDEASVDAAVKAVVERAGRIDVLVNNAGIAHMGPTEAFSIEQAKSVFETNVFGVQRMNRAVLPHMRRQQSGLVVNVSSAVGRIVAPFMGIYAASKFALEAMAESYRLELAAFGVDSVSVEPGAFPTEIFGKIGQPDDAARLESYGPALGALESMNASFGEILSGSDAADPQAVADRIVDLVEMEPGMRPMRSPVGHDAALIAPLNATADQVQEQFLNSLGLASESKQAVAAD